MPEDHFLKIWASFMGGLKRSGYTIYNDYNSLKFYQFECKAQRFITIRLML